MSYLPATFPARKKSLPYFSTKLVLSGSSVFPSESEEKISLIPGSRLWHFNDPYTGRQYKYFQMDAWIKIKNILADEYQIIQTVRTTRGKHGQQVGCSQVVHETKDENGKRINTTYDAFVDGGICSPGVIKGSYDSYTRTFKKQSVATIGKPYYITKEVKELSIKYGANYNGKDKQGLIPLNDMQEAAISHEKIWFNSYIIAVNYNGSSDDKVLGLIAWGFDEYGKLPHDENRKLRIQETNSFKKTDKRIIANDYPGYLK